MRKILIILITLNFIKISNAQGWVKTYPVSDNFGFLRDCVQGRDSNIYLLESSKNDSFYIKKINAQGNLLQNLSFHLPGGLSQTILNKFNISVFPDGNLLVSIINDISGIKLYKFDSNLNLLWTKTSVIGSIVKIYSNTIYIYGTLNINDPFAIKIFSLDLDGNIKAQINLPISILDFEFVDDGIICSGYDNIYKLNYEGELISKSLDTTIIYKVDAKFLRLGNNEFILPINATQSPTLFCKIDKNLNILWKKDPFINISARLNASAIFPDNENGFFALGQVENFESDSSILLKYDNRGNLIKRVIFKDYLKDKLYINSVLKIDEKSFAYFGIHQNKGSFGIKADTNGVIYQNQILGVIKTNFNKDCILTDIDKGFRNTILTVSSDSVNYKIVSNEKGEYTFRLDTGNYIIKPSIIGVPRYWQLCTPSVAVNITNSKLVDTINFVVKPLISAPLMQVDITTPFLRRCFSNTYYVQYCNKGTTQAKDAFVDITLDSLIEYQSATLPLKSRNGNIYRFNLGNVEINECNKFEITGRIRCGDSTRLGQTLCVKAKIYPDTTGAPTTNWSGANITIKGGCVGDSAVFIIKNEGTAASKPLKAKTYQNEDVFESFNLQLPAQGIMTKKYKSNNKTWRITSEQEPNHPSSTRPTKFVEPCSNEPILTLQSPALAFSSDDFALSVDEDCQQIIGAYDPNDKTGYPLGKKAIGQIPENQDIEYIIRFQNTGTDTAFTVVIKDTLPTVLDASSIQWGASSHNYTPSFEGKNVAVFTFNNILLVDSFTNEPKSNGFVRFRIKQNLNLAKGTKIQNSAGIYFDFNPPIITNKTLHTIGVDEFTSPISEIFSQDLINVKVSPNPFTDKTHFKLEKPLVSVGEIEVFDLNGRSLQTEMIKNQEFDFSKKNLKSGIYIFKITENGQIIGQGKIAVQ